jgi:hypothetical protein
LKRPRIAKSGSEVEVSKVSDVAIKQTAHSSRCYLVKSQQRLGVGISNVKRNNGYSYTADIKRNSKKVYPGTYSSIEKAKEIHDIFVSREAQTKPVASHLTNHTWDHYFVNKQLHLRSPESLTTTWEERYSAYNRFRTKCFTDQYQSHQVEFSTLNTKRLDYNPYLRPYPLYFTQLGIPRESQQTCKAISYQLHRFDLSRTLVPELHLVAFTCKHCNASFATPANPNLCGTTNHRAICRHPCSSIKIATGTSTSLFASRSIYFLIAAAAIGSIVV